MNVEILYNKQLFALFLNFINKTSFFVHSQHWTSGSSMARTRSGNTCIELPKKHVRKKNGFNAVIKITQLTSPCRRAPNQRVGYRSTG